MKPTNDQIINWGREALNKTGDLIPTEWNLKLLDALCSIVYEAGRKDENEANKDRIETLCKMYEQASQQRDELMQAQSNAIRARREQ